MTADKMLARIEALVRQADYADSRHQGEAFWSMAQQLATRHAINLALAPVASREHATPMPVRRRITIGKRDTYGLATYVQLFATIAAANDVRVEVADNSTWVIAFGLESDIAVVEVLYTALRHQMVYDARAARASARLDYDAAGRHRGGSFW